MSLCSKQSSAVETKLKKFCDMIRVRVGVFRVIGLELEHEGDEDSESSSPSLPPNFAQRCIDAQSLVKQYSDRTLISFLPLPLLDEVRCARAKCP